MTIDLRKMMDGMRAQLEKDEAEGRLAGLTVKDLEDAISHPEAAAAIADAMAAEAASVKAGEPAPDFTLPWLPGHAGSDEPEFTLSAHAGRRPVALVFGSYTWPPFRAQAGTLDRIFERFRDRVAFAVVYIREIHPSDGWQVKENERDAVLVRQHRSMEERVEVAQSCMLKLALGLPAVVDAMDDSVTTAWAGMPERLYLVGRDGRVAYKGGIGPMFFRPLEWERAIEAHLTEDR